MSRRPRKRSADRRPVALKPRWDPRVPLLSEPDVWTGDPHVTGKVIRTLVDPSAVSLPADVVNVVINRFCDLPDGRPDLFVVMSDYSRWNALSEFREQFATGPVHDRLWPMLNEETQTRIILQAATA